METSLFPDYVLDDTLNVDNCINDNDGDENHISDNTGNNDHNHHNDHNDDDNNNNYDNGHQTIMIHEAMHFGKSFLCEKAQLWESAQMLMHLHS